MRLRFPSLLALFGILLACAWPQPLHLAAPQAEVITPPFLATAHAGGIVSVGSARGHSSLDRWTFQPAILLASFSNTSIAGTERRQGAVETIYVAQFRHCVAPRAPPKRHFSLIG